MSQSLRQIGRPGLHPFFFPVKFESVTTLFSMKYGTWFLDEQDTRQNTELKKCIVQSVYCVYHAFHVYFDKQVPKKL